ncbi:ferredoxin [Enterococcus florum]|uniref:Ferredoxin n=1 Tax=Enterococcus florum TaxID=2480627 RepID=A0A4P5P5R6_9ENTE|nr:ferredoxin [Enterococcus florum]GCF92786.1 ferredoxin [Enterococcus florum]
MKCEILPEQCIACGLCQTIAPSFFDYTDEGIVVFVGEAKAMQEFVPVSEEEHVLAATRRCPTRAILLHDSL